MTNTEIATLISERIGPRPVPFDSVRTLALEIYQDLGGTEGDENFEDIYAILLATIPLAEGGGSSVIDDSSISLTKTWSSSKILSELADAGFNIEIVTELPSVGDLHTIYFILKPNSSTGDTYDEWMYINNNWEKIGNTSVDLSNYATLNDISTFITLDDTSIYATKTYVDASLATKADVYEVATVAEIEALFVAPEPEPTYPPKNQIWYTTPDGQAAPDLRYNITVEGEDPSGLHFVSNEYVNGKGIITFDCSIYAMEGWGSKWDGIVTKVWLPYITDEWTGTPYEDKPFTEILSLQSQLTDVYYPGTIAEFTDCIYDNYTQSYYTLLDRAGTNVIHCSDGDFTIPELD